MTTLAVALLGACADSPGPAQTAALRSVAPLVATATPKSAPEPTAPAPSLKLKITSLKAVKAGSTATAQILTVAGASCSIDVEYSSGSSTAAGLDPKKANSDGVARWRWKVGIKTTKGDWPVTVTCEEGAATGSASADITIK